MLEKTKLTDIIETRSRKQFSPKTVLADYWGGLSKTALWTAFAWDEIQNRYRRSKLGLAWIGISYLLFVVIIVFFFRGFAQLDSGKFTIYVAMNFAIFGFLMSSMIDGCAVFSVARPWVKSSTLPHSTYVFKSIAKSLFTFSIQLAIALGLLLYFGGQLSPIALLSIPAFLLILLNAVWLQTILGYLSARYQDLSHFISSISRLFLFMTPILWVRSETGGLRRTISDFNPFTHACEIFTAPILGRMPDPQSVQVMIGLTVFGFICTLLVGGYSHRRLPFWL